MVISWSELLAQASSVTEFSFDSDNLGHLEIRDSGRPDGFHFFYDRKGSRLITDFALDERPKVALLCTVTLVRKGELFSPRIRLWCTDKTKAGKVVAEQELADTPELREVKATVFVLAPSDSAELVSLLESQDKQTLLDVVQVALGAISPPVPDAKTISIGSWSTWTVRGTV